MEPNPYEPPNKLVTDDRSPPVHPERYALDDPVLAYTANDNLEAHSIVTWLHSDGVRAYAVEDNSGVSIYAFGTLSQFHNPQVFVDRADLEAAGELLRQFEAKRDASRRDLADTPPISSKCEVCGTVSDFPASQDGTIQNCPKCDEFMDIGSLKWPDDCDFGDAETAPAEPDNADDAIDAATKLDKLGDWDGAIVAYRTVSVRWPEHTTYIANCIANVQRKIDANR